MSEAIDVAVVGYGPVGATAANLLGRAGLRAAVFEATTSIYHLPRAAHFDGEIMRVFQAIGLAEDVLPATAPIIGMDFVTGARVRLFGMSAAEGPTEHGWPTGFMFYQPDLERALRAGVARLPGVTVHLGHEVTDLVSHEDGVALTVRDLATQQARTVAARWVLGCDGARSITRKQAGIELEDLEFDQAWLVIDTMLQRPVDLPARVLQICDPARPTTFIPSAGRHRRWEFMLMPGETAEEMQRPERVRELLGTWASPGDVEIIRSAVYSFHALLARRWRERGAFLVGDSAHQMPPFLGQGMCSGIRDAANLVWKLALVHRGKAADALLDSYEVERAPHVRTIVELAVNFGRIIQTTDPAVAAARDAQFLANPASAFDPGRNRMPGLVDGVLHREGDGDPAGQLFPQSRVRTRSGTPRLLDDLLGPSFAFVARNDPRALLSTSSRAFLEAIGTRFVTVGDGLLEEAGGVVGEWLLRHGAALVRPDRYVFGVARDLASGERLTSTLRAWVRGH